MTLSALSASREPRSSKKSKRLLRLSLQEEVCPVCKHAQAFFEVRANKKEVKNMGSL